MSVIEEFQRAYPTKEDKEKALKAMSNEQIDELIKAAGIVQAKIYYSSFKKSKETEGEEL